MVNNLQIKPTKLGFTLIELIVVISVISILAGIVIVSYSGWRKSTITTQVKSDLNGVASAMESARTFNNAYLASITSSTTFKPSQGVTLSGGSSDGGQTYCVDASSTQDATIHYYIDSISGDAGAQAGTCATRSIPVLTATPASISSINLSWTAVPGATSYTLQIASSSTFADASTIATQSGLTYTSTGLSAATTYYYRVGVTTSTGLWSATKSATTTITAPAAPTVIANTSGSTTTWQWSVADCPTGTTGRYQYRYTTSSGGDSGLVVTGNTSIGFNTSGQGITYTVAVQAQCYNTNASSTWSGSGSASYSRPITVVPTNLIAATASSTSINISWGASAGATSYTLQRDTNSSFTSATTIATQAGLTFTSSGLNQGTPYYYRVRATDINGTSNWSTTATATTTINTPAAPTVAANTVTTTTTWTWNAASCAAGTTARYQYRYTITPSGYDSGLVATAGTSVAFTTATGGQTYTVQVQAQCYTASTSSGWSISGSASYYMPIAPIPDQIYTTPGTYTFTVPAGINQIIASIASGGGGGGGAGRYTAGSSGGGGGGGGAGSTITPITVTPGQQLSVVVGAGGSGGAGHIEDGFVGTAGTNSAVGSISVNGGGGGGGGGGGYGYYGGNGGVCGSSNGTYNLCLNGQDGTSVSVVGGSGSSSIFGIGGYSALYSGAPAGGIGAGGGGGSMLNTGLPGNGGAGGNGKVIIMSIINQSHNSQIYTTPGTYTFTVPAGINQIIASIASGGGGGGGAGRYTAGSSGGGGGGGGAGSTITPITVTPGQQLSVVVGAGGSGGAGHIEDGFVGTAGTNSAVGSISVNGGGGGGGGGGGYGYYGGNGGVCGSSNGTYNLCLNGQDGTSVSVVGGSGSSSIFGIGGYSALYSGAPAGGIGAGGGGGSMLNTGLPGNGGAGGNGKVLILW